MAGGGVPPTQGLHPGAGDSQGDRGLGREDHVGSVHAVSQRHHSGPTAQAGVAGLSEHLLQQAPFFGAIHQQVWSLNNTILISNACLLQLMVLKCDQVSETTPNVCPVEKLFRRSKMVALSLSNSPAFGVMKTWQFAEDIEKENN